MTDAGEPQRIWVGSINDKKYSKNPLCQSTERDCPGVCIYCLEHGEVDESLEISEELL